MAEGSIDVLMRVTGPGGPMAAESSTEFRTPASKDELTAGFNVGFFCELREFNFSAGVESSLDPSAKQDVSKLSVLEQKKRSDAKLLKQQDKEKLRESLKDRPEERRQLAIEGLEKRQGKQSLKRLKGDTTDMQPVEFTRVMDTMTVPLFASLVNCETLPTLSGVKRKAVNARQSGDGYLRLDFENVLITSLDWKDGEHLMLETGKFIYRKLTIRYRPQDHNGNLGVTVSSTWEMKTVRASA